MSNEILIEDNENEVKETNIGYGNRGNHNIGDTNLGNRNLGNRNIGDYNRGCDNIGHVNCGHRNQGNGNCGDSNFGHFNSGDDNYGDSNCGYCNYGSDNRGAWNKCDSALGLFNTKPSYIYLFNKPTTLTWEQFTNLPACELIRDMPVSVGAITRQEEFKELNIKKRESWTRNQEWWAGLLAEEKQLILSLPNFDKEIFKEITHIDVAAED